MHAVLPLALTAYVILMASVRNLVAFFPSFASGGSVQVRSSLFIPVCLLAGLMMCLESRLGPPEISATRRVALLDVGLTIAFTSAGIAVSFVVAVLANSPESVAVGRNTAFLAGLMLLARNWAGPPAVMIPFAWIMVVMFVGFRTPSDPRPWTIIPEPAGAIHAAVGAFLMFIIGIAAQLYTSRKLE
ncbi:hypothetical protein ACI2L4_03265 [Streptomyces sparsogenes]|uniref:hypothetical protein n=1 Tax=Streptomyces sparsogenes TaxID=67365 RepID=UPI0033CB7DB3